jgi:hypothetical protein
MPVRKLLLLIALFGGLASCKKVLDKEPYGDLDADKRFNVIEDYDFTLDGAYALFRSTSYYGGTDERSNAYALMPDMMSDNLDESDESLGGSRVMSTWAYEADEDQIERTWVNAYRIIAQANLAIGANGGIDKFAATKQGAVNRIKGQALAIRAFVHFDLLRYWANDFARNSTAFGVPYIKEFDYEVKPKRGTVKETYDNILADLKTAKVLLQNTDEDINGQRGNNRAYMDEYVVNAILARIYLYAAGPAATPAMLDSAIHYSSLIINEPDFALVPFNEFPDIWTDATDKEVIWSVTFESGEGIPGYLGYFPAVDVASYVPSPSLLALYDFNNDIRSYAYFAFFGRDVLVKYLAKEAQLSQPDGTVNFKAFRTGEMYLIRAEAYARKGGASEALGLADLNTLRASRIAGYAPVVLTGAALINAIATERRKELVGEGHRFFDLKRTTRTINRGCTGVGCILAPTDREWAWPIPQPELDANASMSGEQNGGY